MLFSLLIRSLVVESTFVSLIGSSERSNNSIFYKAASVWKSTSGFSKILNSEGCRRFCFAEMGLERLLVMLPVISLPALGWDHLPALPAPGQQHFESSDCSSPVGLAVHLIFVVGKTQALLVWAENSWSFAENFFTVVKANGI